MTTATRDQLNPLMERASAALVDRDYAAAEALCVEALAAAREANDWPYYHRVLLPLQETRRQRRMIAADAGAMLGTGSITPEAISEGLSNLVSLLDDRPAGCVMVTSPHKPTDAAKLRAQADRRGLNWQVLYADTRSEHDAGSDWRVRAFDPSTNTSAAGEPDPVVSCVRRRPVDAWIGRWVDRASEDQGQQALSRCGSASAVDWFLDAAEALGDAAIEAVTDPPGSVERVARLEALIACVPDHEKLHQRLAEAAREL